MLRLAALALALALLLARPALAAEAPEGPVLLTVAGAVDETSRPPFDAFDDAFLNFHDLRFERAVTFDHAMLAALPQVAIRADAQKWDEAVTATGPRLSDVLAAAGVAESAPITLVALDGYGLVLTPEERAAREWVVAISVDGRPLGIGGRGPAWLLSDTADGAADDETEAMWVWSVFAIIAE